MARIIKFRAWDKIDKKILLLEWKGWPLFIDFDGVVCISDCETLAGRSGYELDIMQFTGLLDKNGKEIFEGDIVRFSGFNVNKINNEIFTAEVLFDDNQARYILAYLDVPYFPDFVLGLSECEVIGNIYENPELLKEKNA
jgi:uncharacterized phage protein (TIGR01671 family)